MSELTHPRRLLVTDPNDVEEAATALAGGRFVAPVFGNIYGITARPDARAVRSTNVFKGRPATQAGSVTTTPSHIAGLLDLAHVPAPLRSAGALTIMDELLALGPIGFRGPAADHLPEHLVVHDGAVRTVQVILPGYRCPSNLFLARCLALCGTDHVHITSANRSRHATGAVEEPAHYLAAGIRAEFGEDPRLLILEQAEEVRLTYPQHALTSVTVLALHKLEGSDNEPALVLERHGSLAAADVKAVLARHGFGLTLAPYAVTRLPQRRYSDVKDRGSAGIAT